MWRSRALLPTVDTVGRRRFVRVWVVGPSGCGRQTQQLEEMRLPPNASTWVKDLNSDTPYT